ncbi:hypothetical protein [Leifsonia sp. NCR5]|uniref:hypothetical protein n=1 Tax=Leifsonia sp. NCR5 TaxID=1978342 RepID=UPI00117AA3F3|nr:hypothetical protein [Leifsonia sp. NCR5]
MAGCAPLDLVCAGGAIVSKATNDSLQQLVNNVVEGVGKAFAALGSIWVLVPTPNLTGGRSTAANHSAEGAAGASGFLTILQWSVWISLAICVLSLIAGGALLAVNRRRGDGERHLGRLGVIIGAVILISGASAIVGALLPGMGSSNASDAVGYIQDSLWWYTGGLAVLSVIIAGARMAWTQRAQAGKDLLQSLFTLVVVSAAGLTGIGLAVAAADGFSTWILDGATGKDFGQNITAMIGIASTSGIGLIALLIVGIIATFFAYIQVILMVIRGGMLVLLAGIFPISAAFTNTETGRSWFKKCSGWLIAFILYKPAAAIVYAAAFKLTGADLFKDDGSGLIKILTGLALMAMALVALPALMRFVAPMVSQVGGGGGAGMALAAGAGAGAAELATGAIRKANTGGGSGGGGGSTPNPKATGASNTPATKPAPAPTGTASTGTAATAGKAAGAGAGAGAAAAGPVGVGVMAAQKGLEAGQKAVGAVRTAAADAAGDGASGSN